MVTVHFVARNGSLSFWEQKHSSRQDNMGLQSEKEE